MSEDWPHDPDGDEASEGGRKYGMAIIAKKIDEDEDFPLSKEEFLDEHGGDPIRINHERVVALREIFEYVEPDEFETFTGLHRAVGNAIREGGFWDYHPVGEDPETKRA